MKLIIRCVLGFITVISGIVTLVSCTCSPVVNPPEIKVDMHMQPPKVEVNMPPQTQPTEIHVHPRPRRDRRRDRIGNENNDE